MATGDRVKKANYFIEPVPESGIFLDFSLQVQ
jgi:hypothetical protein